MKEGGVVGVCVELGRRMEMSFSKETLTVVDRRHCLVVVSSNELSKQRRGGNGHGVTFSGAGGS